MAVATDKGVPQSDSFAKYAAAFFSMSLSSVTASVLSEVAGSHTGHRAAF